MGWVKKELKAFTKEIARQGCFLLFGKTPKQKSYRHHRKVPGAVKQYNKAQKWSKRNGFRK